MTNIVGIFVRNICKYLKLSKILSINNETCTFREVPLQAWTSPEGFRRLRLWDL